MNGFIKIALDSFEKKDYLFALNMYSNAIKEDGENEEAKVGILLCDMAMYGDEENARNLLDYYFIIKNTNDDGKNSENAYDVISGIINDNMQKSESINNVINLAIQEKYESIDGILFNDFLQIFEQNGKDRVILENILFSTKIIINDKDDLVSFVSLAVEYGFKNIADNYLDSLIITFEYNKGVIEIMENLRNDDIKLK